MHDEQSNQFYYMDRERQWQKGWDNIRSCRPLYTGPLFNLDPMELLSNVTILPPGVFTLYFGVSYPSTDIFEGTMLVDMATITVTP